MSQYDKLMEAATFDPGPLRLSESRNKFRDVRPGRSNSSAGYDDLVNGLAGLSARGSMTEDGYGGNIGVSDGRVGASVSGYGNYDGMKGLAAMNAFLNSDNGRFGVEYQPNKSTDKTYIRGNRPGMFLPNQYVGASFRNNFGGGNRVSQEDKLRALRS